MQKYILTALVVFIYAITLNGQCYTVFESNSEFTDLYNQDVLDEKACDLQTYLGTADFKVFGADFYPVQAYVDESGGFEFLFNRTINELSSNSGYLLSTKESHSDGLINYRIHIKYSNHYLLLRPTSISTNRVNI